MERYLKNRFVLTIFISFTLSLGIFVLILNETRKSITNELTLVLPLNTWNTMMFLVRPFLLMVPFVVLFTIGGSYFISKNWGNEVTITTTINENNGSVKRKSKIKFFSDLEKQVFKTMMGIDGDIYQNDITRFSGLKKYQISRILFRFESYGIIQKERFGMTNRIFLTVNQLELD